MTSAIEIKLSAARTRLILEHPFLGALLMRLPLKEARVSRCPTLATDARSIVFNPDYIAGLSLAETQFVLAHEALHCALAHFARRSHRVRKRWDVACDHAVNLMLTQEGLRPPPGVLANTEFVGLTAEEIYPLIPSDTSEVPLDAHLFDLGSNNSDELEARLVNGSPRCVSASSGAPGDGGTGNEWDEAGDSTLCAESSARLRWVGDRRADPGALDELVQQWRSYLASAAQAAIQAGHFSGTFRRSLERLIQPRLPWRALLARFLMGAAREDYSFQRGSRRDGDALLPRLGGGGINLIVAIDTSGSIGDQELCEFTSELDALKAQLRANLILHVCDDKLAPDGPWHFAPWDPVALPPNLAGGGATSFVPVFEWIAQQHLRPDVLLFFTDAQGDFPEAPPGYPVIWLVKGGADVPWGQRIQLN